MEEKMKPKTKRPHVKKHISYLATNLELNKNFITKEDYYQMQRYLKAANLKLGLIVNFRTTYLHPKRILCSHS